MEKSMPLLLWLPKNKQPASTYWVLTRMESLILY